jgi:N-acetylmuramoyl-L-alanine amidase
MKKKSSIFIVLIVALNAIAISNNEDCEKRKCIKDIKEVLDATYVLIDPGHGGRDPGAVAVNEKTGEITNEKDLNIDISELLESRLVQLGIDNVQLTRDRGEYLRLTARTARIIELFALAKDIIQVECGEFYPVFISIHQNSNKNKTFKGTEEKLGYWVGENGFKNSLPWMVDEQLREYFDAYGDSSDWFNPNYDIFEFGINMLKDGTQVEDEEGEVKDVKMNIQHTLAEIGFISNSDD